ncbi:MULTISPECIES: hypothetical protein [Sphingomonas]|uniref:Uncharacterized protein n=1 Tax=Sphingomonas molluscorum TaxID=418184 RepID=A0ABU8Q7S0_9SPHN|nr:hypothetical protein [Sphingomonas sp. JUb134]MBM7407078.1 putative transcriptional regulator [Sphingomonas sp. JUb134]
MDEHALGSLGHVTKIAVAWLKNPSHQIAAEDLPSLLQHIHQGVAAVHSGERSPGQKMGPVAGPMPAVAVEDLAPNHSAARRAIAKSIGLGTMRKGRGKGA